MKYVCSFKRALQDLSLILNASHCTIKTQHFKCLHATSPKLSEKQDVSTDTHC